MSDLEFQNLSTVQNELQPKPVTIASATTVAPTTFVTFLSGTVDVTTITPPVTGAHMLVFIFTNATPGDLLTTGNILVGTTLVTQDAPLLLIYNPINAKYYSK